MEGLEIQIEKTNVGLEKKNTGTEFSNRKKTIIRIFFSAKKARNLICNNTYLGYVKVGIYLGCHYPVIRPVCSFITTAQFSVIEITPSPNQSG